MRLLSLLASTILTLNDGQLFCEAFSATPKQSAKPKPKPKKSLPTVEFVNRRKSPALWRDDLSLQNETPKTSSTKPTRLFKSEIMAPAGGWPQLRAAVGNGADAVYLGLSAFSARARATNFDVVDDLPKAVAFCHEHGVNVYVALNVLVFDSELDEVAELIQMADRAGVDALIVQDLGVCKLVQKIAPTLAIHSSTQQTVTSADGVAFCADQHGATRVVLGRELSVEEMAQVVDELPHVEVEAFVHGALCVSYSGQCFSSEAWGGRSANRGQCAQACRLPYGLIANGELIELQDMTYLLSPQDLCGLDNVPALMEAGVSCLKIEGRLKDEAYVAATTRAYRNAVDETWKKLTGQDPTRALPYDDVTRKDLTQMFSRGQDENYGGLTAGFMDGTQHQMLVRGRSPRHRGVHMGHVVRGTSPKNGVIITGPDIDLKLGDGIVIDRGMAQEMEIGGPIFEIARLDEDTVQIQFGKEVTKKWRKSDDMARKAMGTVLAPEGAHVWKTRDATVEKKMRRLSESAPPRLVVKVSVTGSIGSPLVVTITNGDKSAVHATEEPLQAAEKGGLDPKKVKKAIGTLGDTKWAIDGDIDISYLDPDAWCPMSRIKEARRQAVVQWKLLNDDVSSEDENSFEEIAIIRDAPAKLLAESLTNEKIQRQSETPKLTVLARNMDQVNAVCEIVEDGESISEIMIDFLEVEGMMEAVARIREAGVSVVIASPRIIKPGESGIWRTLLRLEPDGLLVRSTGLLHRLQSLGGTGAEVDVGSDIEQMVKIPILYGDFSLNAANALTAMELLNSGLERITASYDINANAITNMGTFMGEKANKLEVTVHAKLPIFHTEHCVFARFLSNGNSYMDCGHVCTRNNVHLRDQSGADNLVLADMGCRNTVFSSEAQSGVHSIEEWTKVGIGALRVELVDEGKYDSLTVVRQYLSMLRGATRPSEVWETLKEIKDSNGRACGVSLGSFNNKIERRAGELE